MKKLLMSSMVLAIMFAPAAFADTTTPEAETGTTYTEQFIHRLLEQHRRLEIFKHGGKGRKFIIIRE